MFGLVWFSCWLCCYDLGVDPKSTELHPQPFIFFIFRQGLTTAQAGLELSNSPASAARVLGLKVWFLVGKFPGGSFRKT